MNMMESDFHIEANGFPDGEDIRDVVIYLINEALKEGLDLRRMHRIIVTMDYAGEVKRLSSTHTDNAHGLGVAQVKPIPRGDGIELVPVFDGRLFEMDKSNFEERIRILHHTICHELCHVHDENKKIDAFPDHFRNTRYSGKDIHIRPLAEYCWAEYITTAMSALTAPESLTTSEAKRLIERIANTKPEIEREIMQLFYHGDAGKLMLAFKEYSDPLIYSAAHMIGFMKGLQKNLVELAPEVAQQISGSYFEPIWKAMCEALAEMHRRYPDNWKDVSIFDDLSVVMDRYYQTMRLMLSTSKNGGAHLDILRD